MSWRDWLKSVVSRYDSATSKGLDEENKCAERLMEYDVPQLLDDYRIFADFVESEKNLRQHQKQCSSAKMGRSSACPDGSCTSLEEKKDEAFNLALHALQKTPPEQSAESIQKRHIKQAIEFIQEAFRNNNPRTVVLAEGSLDYLLEIILVIIVFALAKWSTSLL